MCGQNKPEADDKSEFGFPIPQYKKILPPAPASKIQTFSRKAKSVFISPISTSTETFGTPKLALTLVLISVFVQIGIQMIPIQHKFIASLVCWIIAYSLGVYIVFVWKLTHRVTRPGKLLLSLGIAIVMVRLLWTPERNQYRAEHRSQANSQAQSGTESQPSAKAIEAQKQSIAREAEAARKLKEKVHNSLAQIYNARGYTVTRVFTLLVLPRNTPLKGRALALSDEILDFVARRNEKAPPYPEVETWVHDEEEVHTYNVETVNLFMRNYAASVNSVRDELALKHLRDPGLDQLCEYPASIYGVRVIAQKIADLAERLPSPIAEPKAP